MKLALRRRLRARRATRRCRRCFSTRHVSPRGARSSGRTRPLDVGPSSLPRGGTTYLCAVDGDGMAISLIQSLYESFGSGVVAPGTGVALQNRAAGFSRVRRPPERARARASGRSTRSSPACSSRDGALLGPFGVMGGPMQPQGHFQVVRRLVDDGDATRRRRSTRRAGGSRRTASSSSSPGSAHRGRSLRALGHDARRARSQHGVRRRAGDPAARRRADRRLRRPRRRLRRRPLAVSVALGCAVDNGTVAQP